MKIIIDKGIKSFEKIISVLDGFIGIELCFLNTEEIIHKNIEDAEILFIRSTTKIDKQLIENTKIKVVGSATSGTDHINKEYLERKSIKWFYAGGSNALSVVNYVMSAINHLFEIGVMNQSNTVGIIGYGNIGRRLTNMLEYFSIPSIAHDPFLDFEFLVDIEAIKNCDLISLHVPLTTEGMHPTYNMINEAFINDAQNKILINTSRGGIVDEDCFIKSNLKYISDVWINEPKPFREIVDGAIIATPHIAGHSQSGKINGTLILIKYLQDYLGLDISVKEKNLLKMKEFIKTIKLTGEDGLDVFKAEYDIYKESVKFKHAYLNEDEDKVLIYKNQRSQHPSRRDIKI